MWRDGCWRLGVESEYGDAKTRGVALSIRSAHDLYITTSSIMDGGYPEEIVDTLHLSYYSNNAWSHFYIM